ncbi:MAG: truncated hemoglobin YjbI [Myxococcota bacterium]
MADFDLIGGTGGVDRIVGDLVDRMSADFIIGYLFIGRDRERIVRHELELANAHLGGPRRYTGRPLAAVHKPLRINRGHFLRRIALLRVVLRDHGVQEGVAERWLAHDLALESAITDGTDCVVNTSAEG